MAEEHIDAVRAYYNDFSARYDDARGGNVPDGYHDLIDELEVGIVARYGTGREVLEVGCGTGLVLSRIARVAARAHGVDLSPGMLERARERGLSVTEASATELPFDDASFDVACSFKVLAHIRPIRRALREMVRVVRPGGYVVAEFYNPHSLRALAKRFGPAGKIAEARSEDEVFTRFDTPADVERLLPGGTRIVDRRGIRIVTPTAGSLKLPVLGSALRGAERFLCDTPLARFAGFWVAVIQKS